MRGAHPIRIALDLLIAPLEAARNKALLTAGAAQVGIMAAMAIGFPPPPHLIALRNSALGAAAAAEASILLLEVVKSLAPGTVRINEALGDIANYLAQIDQLWVLRGLADILMGSDQKPRSATAISYALMDIHNYRDWVCSKNGDSIEVFFDAWTPDAKNFLDLVFQRVRQLEDGTLPGSGGVRMAFPGYVAIRFTRATEALLGMQRWGTTVSMEIASINACKGTGPLLRRVHQDALDYLGPAGPRASVHWGQKNTVDMKHVEDAFGAWVTGGRLAQWRSALSELTRNGRDAVFSTEFSRHAGLEVVQPRAYALTAAPGVTCAGSLVSVSWDAENNPPGTQAVLLLTTQTPDAPTRTVGRPSSLRGSAMLEVPPGRHILTLSVQLRAQRANALGPAHRSGARDRAGRDPHLPARSLLLAVRSRGPLVGRPQSRAGDLRARGGRRDHPPVALRSRGVARHPPEPARHPARQPDGQDPGAGPAGAVGRVVALPVGLRGLRRPRADDHRRVWPGLLPDVRRPW